MHVRDDAAEVLDAGHRRAAVLATLTALDRDALTALLHEDLRWTTPRGEVLGRGADVDGDLVWLGQEPTDVDVRVVRDTAVVTALVVDEGERAGQRRTVRMRVTRTGVRGDGSWVLRAGHAGPAGGGAS